MSRLRLLLAALAVVALIALGWGATADLVGTARAWLLGFLFASLAVGGALVLAMIARLTDAPWGRDFAPQLSALAGAAPWLWPLGAPIGLLLPWIYPRAQSGGAAAYLHPYLSPAAFLARAAVALAGWTLLAVLLRRGRMGPLAAALGLVFQAVLLCLIPNDWALSLRPGWTTTDIGMVFLALEIVLATAASLLLGPRVRGRSAGDIAGLLIAGVLGLAYLTFMAYLVDWYGDLPDKVGWWIARFQGGRWLEIILALAAGVLALALLGFGRHRRPAAVCVTLGVVLYCAWLLSPDLGALAWVLAPAGLLFHASAAGLAATFGWRDAPPAEPRHG